MGSAPPSAVRGSAHARRRDQAVARARAGGDRGQRLRGPRHGHPPPAGGRGRRRGPRARGRRRRHVAGQRLPRRAPATCRRGCTPSPSRPTRAGRAPSPRSRRSSPTCATARSASASGGGCGSDTRVERATWDEGTARWTVDTTRGTLTCDVLVSAAGSLSEPRAARHPGPRRVRRADVPLGGVGPPGRAGRQAGRGHRDRGLGGPDRPAAPAGRRLADGLPAHAGVDHPADGPALHAPGAAALPARPAPAEGRRAPRSTGAGSPTSWPSPGAPASCGRPSAWPGCTWRGRSPTPCCARSSRRTTASAASAS